MKSRFKSSQNLHSLVEQELKLFKKKQKLLQIKLFFTLILPAVLALLTVKVFQSFLRIQLKNITVDFENREDKKPGKAVAMLRRKPDFIHPEKI